MIYAAGISIIIITFTLGVIVGVALGVPGGKG